MLRLSIYGSFTLILSYASPLSKASGLLVFLSYRIFSIKPPGGGIFISSTLEGGGGLIREGGLKKRGLLNLTGYCRCDSISLIHLSSPLMRRTRIFNFYHSQYYAILNKNCFEKYNIQ